VLLLWLLIGYASLPAQSIQPSVIASAGGSYANDHLQLDWTLGESVIETVAGGGFILTQGFHQPDVLHVSTLEIQDLGTLSLFPNPARDILHVTVDMKNNTGLQLTIYNTLSQLIWSGPMIYHSDIESIDVSTWAAGTYFVTATSSTGAQGIQIIKTN
jgi:hypothetical protein